jgi:hypothetical protein
MHVRRQMISVKSDLFIFQIPQCPPLQMKETDFSKDRHFGCLFEKRKNQSERETETLNKFLSKNQMAFFCQESG